MKLGIVIILIGIAWCVRCYLLRPQPLPPAAQTQFQVSGNTVLRGLPDDPNMELGVLVMGEPLEGETMEWTYWSAPDLPDPLPRGYSGGTKHSHARRMMTFIGGKWVETERYPKEGVFTNGNH